MYNGGVVGGRGAMPLLDFHTWYKYSIDRGLKVLFFGLFCYFLVFFSVAPPKKFSADALGSAVCLFCLNRHTKFL